MKKAKGSAGAATSSIRRLPANAARYLRTRKGTMTAQAIHQFIFTNTQN